MNTEQLLQELAQTECPRQVDVVDSVMAAVRQRPYLMPKRRNVVLRRIGLSAAAVAAVAVIAVPALMPKAGSNEPMGDMLASVQSYDYYAAVESAAVNPIECLYDEPEDTNE